MAKTNEKSKQTWNSVRISLETKNAAEKILRSANNKNAGRKIKIDEILCFAINLVENDHIKKLQDSSLTFEDHKELMLFIYLTTPPDVSADPRLLHPLIQLQDGRLEKPYSL